MRSRAPQAIEDAFLAACHAELQALKPGNVHIHAGGHGMTVADFERSAAAAAPRLAAAGASVGRRVLDAVEASMAAAGCNTNLGILLLCGPLAAAAEAPGDAPLADRLQAVLASLTSQDAADVYRAIAVASPGGLGRAPEQDVAGAPSVGLVQAMRLAAHRDRIARCYATGFAEIFERSLPLYESARRTAEADAVTLLHMGLMAAEADSHVLRKFGPEVAEQVREEAAALVGAGAGKEALLRFDARLKQEGLNPGTTADLVVATLFSDMLQRETAS
jgi:triphosphoribosyl-dephospho-CoA synthase